MTARRSSHRRHRWALVTTGLVLVAASTGCSFRGDVQAAGTGPAAPSASAGASSSAPAPTSATATASTGASTGPSTGPSTGASSSPTSTAPSAAATATTSTPGAAAGAAGDGSATDATSGPTTGGGTARCRTSDLRVTAVFTDAGAGHRFGYVRFTNAGASACALGGHPGVSLVAGDDGHQVGAAAQRQGAVVSTTLAPGAVASAGLSLAQADAYDSATCRPTAVRGFRVYPPGQTASTFVALDGVTGCAATSVSLMTVGPVQAGAGS